MAKIDFGTGLEDYLRMLHTMGVAIEGVCKFALYDAAGMVADAIKENTPYDNGDLKESLTIANFKNDNGYIYTVIGFEGYDRKGTPNSLKARVIESGTSDQTHKKHPFIRPAVNSVKQAAELSIEMNFDRKIKEIAKIAK